MDRRTLIAVILSVVVITIGFSIQTILNRPSAEERAAAEAAQVEGTQTEQEFQTTEPVSPTPETPTITDAETAAPSGAVIAVPLEDISSQPRVYRDARIEVTLDPVGGTVTSYKLLEHLDGEEPVDMVFRGNDDQRAQNGFTHDRLRYPARRGTTTAIHQCWEHPHSSGG